MYYVIHVARVNVEMVVTSVQLGTSPPRAMTIASRLQIHAEWDFSKH